MTMWLRTGYGDAPSANYPVEMLEHSPPLELQRESSQPILVPNAVCLDQYEGDRSSPPPHHRDITM